MGEAILVTTFLTALPTKPSPLNRFTASDSCGKVQQQITRESSHKISEIKQRSILVSALWSRHSNCPTTVLDCVSLSFYWGVCVTLAAHGRSTKQTDELLCCESRQKDIVTNVKLHQPSTLVRQHVTSLHKCSTSSTRKTKA